MKKTLLSILALFVAVVAGAQTTIDFNNIASLGLTESDFVTVENGEYYNTYHEINTEGNPVAVIGDANVQVTVDQASSTNTAKIWKTTVGAYELRAYKNQVVKIALKNGKKIIKIKGEGSAANEFVYSGDPTDEVTINVTATAKVSTIAITAEGEVDPEPGIEHISIADFLMKADPNTTYELTGTVKNIINTSFGNFDLVEDGVSLYIYGLLDFEGNKKNFESLGIKEGAVITITGKYAEWNDMPEIIDAQIIKIISSGDDPTKPEEVTIAKALEIADALADGATTDKQYILEGTITNLENISLDYGNATFTIADSGNEIYVYRCKDIDNEKFTDENKIKVGDAVRLQGKLKKYVKDESVLLEVVNCYLLDINGTGIDTIAADAENAAIYNVAGQKVSANYKGIVIKNNKKFLMK